MARFCLLAAAVNGFIAVAAGAFAAHGLRRRMTPEGLTIFETAARYEMYHALALLAVAWLAAQRSSFAVATAAWAFALGILLFSGSLYLLCFTGRHWLGAITPIGGVAFLIGWASLAWAAWQDRAG